MRTLLVILALAAPLAGCGDGSIVRPPVPDSEDWSFPQDSAKVALTLVAPDSVRLGGSFDVKLVVYNLPELFGAAVNVEYDRDRVVVERVLIGPALQVNGNLLGVAVADTTRGRVQFASTMRNGEIPSLRTSGVLCKLRCRATATGTARFQVDSDFSLTTSVGADIPGRSRVHREDARIPIR